MFKAVFVFVLTASAAMMEEEIFQEIFQCATTFDVLNITVESYLFNNDSVPENIMEYFVCCSRAVGYIENNELTEESLSHAINSDPVIPEDEKDYIINVLKTCLDHRETKLNHKVLKFLRCKNQMLINTEEVLPEPVRNCEIAQNVREEDVFFYLKNNDSVPENIKGFYVCLMEGYNFIQNGSITQESITHAIQTNPDNPEEEKTYLISVFLNCLDSEETDLNEKVIKLMRCRAQVMNSNTRQ